MGVTGGCGRQLGVTAGRQTGGCEGLALDVTGVCSEVVMGVTGV